ncbi:hypothetical protein [Kitasatospora sp. NPDC093102]|uniref:hypothetical protein n=1 Tax=Kitasatospora sp. NPDC093102 TaxID=3155069 RepID=UPI003423956A
MNLPRENPVLALFVCPAPGHVAGPRFFADPNANASRRRAPGHHLKQISADHRAEWNASRAS